MNHINNMNDTGTDKLKNTLVFFVNGKKIVDDSVNPECTLLSYLREKLHRPGTKLGCAEGGCGACTVMVSKIDQNTEKITHYTVNACLALIGSMHGMAVTTVEGIGSTKTRLHPVQERLAKSHGSQCGFCTPGFVMSMYTLLRNNPLPTMQEIEENLVGNLCRCTGYRPILEGFRTFSKESQTEHQLVMGCGRKDCCQLNKAPENAMSNALENGLESNGEKEFHSTAVLFNPEDFISYDSTQEVIFPPELKIHKKDFNKSMVLKGKRFTYYRPTTLSELLMLKNKHQGSKIVVGNTEVGVEVKFKNQEYPVIINPLNVSELLGISIAESSVEVGAAVTLSDIETSFKNIVTKLEESRTGIVHSFLEMLNLFSSRQIRNVACLGGNIMTGSPISDLNPLLMAAGAVLKFQNINGRREIRMDENFFIGYRKTVTNDNDVLISIKIPFTNDDEYFEVYKQSKRKQDDIAIVNSAMKIKFKPESLIIDSLALAFGGMAPTTVMAKNTMKNFEGCEWNDSLVEKVTASLLEELKLDPSAPGGMTEYREALCAGFFLKFYIKVSQSVKAKYPKFSSQTRHEESEKYYPTKSMQFFQNVPREQAVIDPVGRPIPHAEALQQTTGEATYTDDIPKFMNELHAAVVTSTRCHAKIISIDPTEALSIEGVEGFFCAKDLSGERNHIAVDEEVFASERVVFYGQIIGLIVAKDHITATRAAKVVKVTYEHLPNPILTIEDAIKANSLFGPCFIETGDVDKGFAKSDHILEGEIRIGGQEHFYLETQGCIAIPHENDEMEIIASTQDLFRIQKLVANALDVPANRVRCRVKKIGGGFGGKETRPPMLSVPAALAASRLNCPVRLMLDRHDDMIMMGRRHPFLGRWKAGFNDDGTLVAVEQYLYSNAGCSSDLSPYVMLRAAVSSDNVYRLENFKVVGQCCKTNMASNTAFRAFGAPQGMLVMEDIMSRIAHYLRLDLKTIQEKNLYRPAGDRIPCGQELSDCKVHQCWEEVICKSDYGNRRKIVDEFNSKCQLKKRGIATTAAKYGIGRPKVHGNQGAALIHIYTDGSILISHGGIEIGQGLHTKMLQVASRALQVPLDKLYICDTATDKVPNATSTCASISSDIVGGAILDASDKLLRRIAPYKKQHPKGRWEDWIHAAYMDRVSLSATGFYKIPVQNMIEYDFSKKNYESATKLFNYYCYGAAVSEVEIDCLTGDHRILRTDIVMDVGTSLNPAIDVGQIEGAFTQGLGMLTIEELTFSPEGILLTRGPGAYKIPGVQDIPREFNVSFLRGSENPRAVYSSKAVGEPPLCLALSVFLAIKDAIKAARGGDDAEVFRLDSPATAERIRMACEDSITEKIKRSEPGSYTPWSIAI